ncbi:MAG: hypothetical protein MJE77_19385 [Proteobacteria bacterium]|nr:hypothetical protein [Pseudomonadota bacterium]
MEALLSFVPDTPMWQRQVVCAPDLNVICATEQQVDEWIAADTAEVRVLSQAVVDGNAWALIMTSVSEPMWLPEHCLEWTESAELAVVIEATEGVGNRALVEWILVKPDSEADWLQVDATAEYVLFRRWNGELERVSGPVMRASAFDVLRREPVERRAPPAEDRSRSQQTPGADTPEARTANIGPVQHAAVVELPDEESAPQLLGRFLKSEPSPHSSVPAAPMVPDRLAAMPVTLSTTPMFPDLLAAQDSEQLEQLDRPTTSATQTMPEPLDSLDIDRSEPSIDHRQQTGAALAGPDVSSPQLEPISEQEAASAAITADTRARDVPRADTASDTTTSVDVAAEPAISKDRPGLSALIDERPGDDHPGVTSTRQHAFEGASGPDSAPATPAATIRPSAPPGSESSARPESRIEASVPDRSIDKANRDESSQRPSQRLADRLIEESTEDFAIKDPMDRVSTRPMDHRIEPAGEPKQARPPVAPAASAPGHDIHGDSPASVSLPEATPVLSGPQRADTQHSAPIAEVFTPRRPMQRVDDARHTDSQSQPKREQDRFTADGSPVDDAGGRALQPALHGRVVAKKSDSDDTDGGDVQVQTPRRPDPSPERAIAQVALPVPSSEQPSEPRSDRPRPLPLAHSDREPAKRAGTARDVTVRPRQSAVSRAATPLVPSPAEADLPVARRVVSPTPGQQPAPQRKPSAPPTPQTFASSPSDPARPLAAPRADSIQASVPAESSTRQSTTAAQPPRRAGDRPAIVRPMSPEPAAPEATAQNKATAAQPAAQKPAKSLARVRAVATEPPVIHIAPPVQQQHGQGQGFAASGLRVIRNVSVGPVLVELGEPDQPAAQSRRDLEPGALLAQIPRPFVREF